jgi:hypothetical protein
MVNLSAAQALGRIGPPAARERPAIKRALLLIRLPPPGWGLDQREGELEWALSQTEPASDPATIDIPAVPKLLAPSDPAPPRP